MERIKSDSRFSHILSDPRFRRIPKREKKVKIDKRFNAMFKDERFKLNYTVDKRGRQINHTTTEDLKKYYELSSECSSSDELEDESSNQSHLKQSNDYKSLTNTNCVTKTKGNIVTVGKSDNEISSEILNKKIPKKKKSLKKSVNLNKKLTNKKSCDYEDSDLNEDDQTINSETLQKKNCKNQLKKLCVTEADSYSLSKNSSKKLNAFLNHNKKYNDDNEEGSALSEASDRTSDKEEEIESDENEETANKDETDSDSIDLARDDGNIESSDTDDDSSEEEDNNDYYHPWGELDTNVPKATEITHRLAVCNMNWDRIKAQDLLLLFNSFKPSTGIIKAVTIYPTEFGKQRMMEDEIKGPHELVEETISDDEEATPEGTKFHMEKLRKYQINRLKYYYAVLECDSPETANKIYEECDGVEYESSATRLDLRFIPDSMTFDEEPHSIADTLSNIDNYRPNLFTTTALQQAKVDLTWDETDPDRIQATQEAFNRKDLDNIDLKAYLASGSEDEGEDDNTMIKARKEKDENVDSDNDGNTNPSISKYRALLKSIEDEEKKKSENDVQMEITWEPGLREAAEEIVKKKELDKEELTPWEQYLKKKKDKKLLKKKERLLKKNNGEEVQDSNPYSDDELPSDVDLNDTFFQGNLNSPLTKKKTKKKKSRKQDVIETEEDKQKRGELELLLMDENDTTKHFRLNNIIKNDDDKQKKKQKDKVTFEDDFQVDVKDPRFSALYSSHLYNVDPSDHQFKRTKGMEAIIEEKQRRRINEDDCQNIGSLKPNHSNHELSALIKSVKRKSSNLLMKNVNNKKKK